MTQLLTAEQRNAIADVVAEFHDAHDRFDWAGLGDILVPDFTVTVEGTDIVLDRDGYLAVVRQIEQSVTALHHVAGRLAWARDEPLVASQAVTTTYVIDASGEAQATSGARLTFRFDVGDTPRIASLSARDVWRSGAMPGAESLVHAATDPNSAV